MYVPTDKEQAHENWRIDGFIDQFGMHTMKFRTAVLKRAKLSSEHKLKCTEYVLELKGLHALAAAARQIRRDKFGEPVKFPMPAVSTVAPHFRKTANGPSLVTGHLRRTKSKSKPQPQPKPEVTHVKPERKLALDKDI